MSRNMEIVFTANKEEIFDKRGKEKYLCSGLENAIKIFVEYYNEKPIIMINHRTAHDIDPNYYLKKTCNIPHIGNIDDIECVVASSDRKSIPNNVFILIRKEDYLKEEEHIRRLRSNDKNGRFFVQL